MGVTRQRIMEALRLVKYPGFGRDIVSLGMVERVEIEDDRVRLTLQLGPGTPEAARTLEKAARQAVEALEGVTGASVHVGGPSSPGLRMAGSGPPSVAAGGSLDAGLLPEVRHVVAVASGKGGVGKSTVAVNLAVAMAQGGAAVGLLDADIYGPSIPLMMGVQEPVRLDPEGRRLVPFQRHGIRFMSLGFLVDPASAVIWRGPLVMKAVEQLLREVEWGALDVLVVDMPPGTGDVQLTLSQKVRLAGAVIVTTPQDVALADAIKGVNMFRKVDVPVLGIVENMSFFSCPHCGERAEIFGYGGGRREAERLKVPFLGEIPLDPRIRDGGDTGVPIVVSDDSPRKSVFVEIAATVLAGLDPEGGSDDGTDDRGGIFERFQKKFGGPRPSSDG